MDRGPAMTATVDTMTSPETDFAAACPRRPRPCTVRATRRGTTCGLAATAAIVLIHVIAYALGVNYGHVGALPGIPRYNELLAFGQTLQVGGPRVRDADRSARVGPAVEGRARRVPRLPGAPGDRSSPCRTSFWATVYYLLRPSVLGVPWPSGGVLPVLGDYLGSA